MAKFSKSQNTTKKPILFHFFLKELLLRFVPLRMVSKNWLFRGDI